ncbi:Furin-like protease 2 [Chamberlinius hualienensis]
MLFKLMTILLMVTFVCETANWSGTGGESDAKYGISEDDRLRKERSPIYMNQFAVKVEGGTAEAERIAKRHGFSNLGQIGSLDGYYLFEHQRISKRSTDHSIEHHNFLEDEKNVVWVEQQVELKRTKRDFFDAFRNFPLVASPSSIFRMGGTTMVGHGFPDPLYGEQWYLHAGAVGGYDMNVIGAWQKGYTGKGVVITILDDGIQTNHPDLSQNYDPYASIDINGNDNDPMPQDNGDNKHGTRCAGEVAATAYNGVCGVGIAYNASIGGVRMLDGTVNDAVEARALSHNPGHIDIYSASWGPEDDGKTVDGPGPLARRAFIDGVTKGRQGKGSIFIWASGNGGRHEDNCNCDGYTNSIYTLSISSATQHGLKPWYLEECSSTLATTYSSGTPGQDRSVITVDMNMEMNPQLLCTREHTGTSASAPIAAAICALALEANSHLTWRDMQYLVQLTSKSAPLESESGWIVNGVNRKVSHKFGYGLMDAEAMVSLAERWLPVPPQKICELPPDMMERSIPNEAGASVEFYLDTDGCMGTFHTVNYLEHVQAKISLNFSPRGNLKIILQSPYGTSSTLLYSRPRDTLKTTFDDWPFLSVHFWGERPVGRWRLIIINEGPNKVHHPGVLKRWSLVFYGTETDPLKSSASVFPQFGAASMNSMSAVLPTDALHRSANASSTNINCHGECLGSCRGVGSEDCFQCRNLRMTVNSKTVCVKECPDGWYATPNQECLRCHSTCKTCSGGTVSDCLVCQTTLYLLRDNDSTKCVATCPNRYFEDKNRICSLCNPMCEKCEKSPDWCTKCHFSMVLFNNTCLAGCPPRTYNDNRGRCNLCDPSCKTCSGPGATECITCSNNTFHLHGSCVLSCPIGYYHLFSSNECYRCDPDCRQCTADRCLICRAYLQLDNDGHCVQSKDNECPSGTYHTDGQCLSCHVSCEKCIGPAFTHCTACPKHRYLFKNVCVESCPSGHFHNKLDKICGSCHFLCANCAEKSPHECYSCLPGQRLNKKECSSCKNGYYNAKYECNPCTPGCETCIGPLPKDCLTCSENSTFAQNIEKCRNTTCDKGLHLVANKCVKCQSNEFYHPINEKCELCHETCGTCLGPDKFSCLSCVPPLKYDSQLHRCVPCCKQQDSNCCRCDHNTGNCTSIISTSKRRTSEPASSILSTFLANDPSQDYYKSNHKSDEVKKTIITVSISSCVLAILAFLVIFVTLQARSYFSSKLPYRYKPVPVQYEFQSDPVFVDSLSEPQIDLRSTART